MAKVVLTNVRMFATGADLTSHSNTVEFGVEVADVDTTNYGSGGSTELLGGLRSVEVTAGGQWDALDLSFVDDSRWAQVGAGVGPWTIAPVGAADGALAYLTRVMQGSYSLGGAVGDVAPWEATGMGTGGMARGVIAHPPGTARTTSGTGTSVNLGAVAAGQRLVAAIHVLSVTSTLSITPRIETDDATGFPSATTRLTGSAYTTANSPGSQWLETDGTAITDTWQRSAWTTSGSGSALFVVSIGII